LPARRYHTLDGLRGVAAITVAIGHATLWFAPLPAPQMWLAVDLFFVISGFVLADVYAPRFRAGMTMRQFMLERYIRLYPLYLVGLFIGTISGLTALLMGTGKTSTTAFALYTLSGLLLLPSPTPADSTSVVPLNPPGWSLIFELFANAIFALLGRHLNTLVLICIVTVAGVFLIYDYAAYREGFGGATWGTFARGVPRVMYSFFVGVLLAKYLTRRFVQTTWSWAIITLLIPAFWLSASMGPSAGIVLQLIGFPLIVAVAAVMEPKSSVGMAALGLISYPLYAIHFPIWMLLDRAAVALKIPPSPWAPISGVAVMLVMCGLSWRLHRSYDEPARAFLKRQKIFIASRRR
jgi:peptidoglycan/LPS O-acetylase OafA/YrhL